jgi:hypothetical protein
MPQNRREPDDDATPASHDDATPASGDRTPMREVSHTNPYTNESMGSVFEHGVTIVADGGERGAVDEDPDREADDENQADAASESRDADEEQMKDVSHEAPGGGHGNRMFERVGKTADVVDEE